MSREPIRLRAGLPVEARAERNDDPCRVVAALVDAAIESLPADW